MANKDAPFGLTPIRHRNGAPYNGASKRYFVPATQAALFVGDPVIRTSTSNTAAIEGANIATLPEVNKSGAGNGNSVTGIIVGFDADGNNQDITHNPLNTARIVHVADDPDLIFLIQDDAGGSLTSATVGGSANFIFTETGSSSTGQSGVELDAGTIGTSSTDQMNIDRLHDVEGNTFANFGLWEVKLNNHTEAHGAAGI